MIDRAVEILRRGGLVAFPTETVYGLGADARSADAIAKIFAAKGRPATNPLIVHVHSAAAAKPCSSGWPKIADRLADKFWPGPLTLVVKKAKQIVAAVAAGGDTVGLRVPAHSLALELLEAFDGPLAAPSANRSNRISPTTADHVRQELGDRVELVLDGGACQVGIESTVLDLTTNPPTLLRPGGVSREEIEAVIGPITLPQSAPSATARSPGQQSVHYSPVTPAFWIEFGGDIATAGQSVLLTFGDERPPTNQARIEMPDNPQNYARELYGSLRHADAMRFARIVVELPPNEPRWAAVRDRLVRASRPLNK